MVFVTRHAIERFKNRILLWTKEKLTDEEIAKKLRRVVQKGHRVCRRPGGSRMYEYKKLYVAVSCEGKKKIIVTFLGDNEYRNWHQKISKKIKRKIA